MSVKQQLLGKLIESHAFWSYDIKNIKDISDEFLILNVLMHLDLEEINMLFSIFSKREIKKVWKEKMSKSNYSSKNKLFKILYF